MIILCCGNSEFSLKVFEKIATAHDVKILTKPGSIVAGYFRSKFDIYEFSSLRNLVPGECVGDYDVIFSCDFGLIIPSLFVQHARLFDINLHTSVLPRHRGPAPIQWTIISGDSEAGISYIRIADRVDAGEVYAKYSFEIDDSVTYSQLREELLRLSESTVLEVIHGVASGSLKSAPQDEALATYAPKIGKDDESLKLSDAKTMLRWVHALSYTPGAHVVFKGKRLKLFRCKITDQFIEPGMMIADGDSLLLGTKSTALEITECQLEGKRRVSGKDFVNGYSRFLPERVI